MILGSSGHDLDPFTLQQQQAHAMYQLQFDKTQSNADGSTNTNNKFASDFQAMYGEVELPLATVTATAMTMDLPEPDLEQEPRINFDFTSIPPTSDDTGVFAATGLIPSISATPPREITRRRIHQSQAARLKDAILIASKSLERLGTNFGSALNNPPTAAADTHLQDRFKVPSEREEFEDEEFRVIFPKDDETFKPTFPLDEAFQTTFQPPARHQPRHLRNRLRVLYCQKRQK
ncbi:hypothetical protein MHU86_4702 [Fragilaria crotonensis]|nr:hypothetical protein MHU86_4702 [Fragilaria crotonensis]